MGLGILKSEACFLSVAPKIDGLGFKPKGSRDKRNCTTAGSSLSTLLTYRKARNLCRIH